ncbi:MAG: restriction endonuclease subunit S [Polyangiaceae bacterium]
MSVRESAVEWCGVVPTHWRTTRLKATVASIKNGVWGDEPDGETDLPCVRVADFDRQRLCVVDPIPTWRAVPLSSRKGRMLSRGDLLLEKSGGGEGQPVGTVVLYDLSEPAVCSNFVARVEAAADTDSSFLRYLHASLYGLRITTRSIKQTTGIQNLDGDAYLAERIELPPLVEQRAIASFLDRKTAAIDGLIEKKERLIELLQEKRQALITQAVTKGLDPTVPMKDSGIEWLGEIPAHWEVTRFRRFCALSQGLQIPREERFNEPGPRRARYITVQSLNAGADFNGWEYIENPSARVRCTFDDILMARTGATGEVISGVDGAFHNNFFKVQLQGSSMSKEYAVALLRCPRVKEHLLMLAGTTTIPDLNHDEFLDTPVVLPPESEQDAIARHAKKIEDDFELLVRMSEHSIGVLREYRQALISAAVTGKIDVSEQAA